MLEKLLYFWYKRKPHKIMQKAGTAPPLNETMVRYELTVPSVANESYEMLFPKTPKPYKIR